MTKVFENLNKIQNLMCRLDIYFYKAKKEKKYEA